MTIQESHDDLERRTLELLPWYVNGTLNDEEHQLVSRQALTSLPCRKGLERLRRLQGLMQLEDAEAAATSRAFERLMARIHASDSSRLRVRQPARRFAWTGLALAASVAAIVSVPMWWRADDSSVPPRIYETLTRSQPVEPGGVRLRVVFSPGVTESEKRELLARHGVAAVGAPTEEGVVTLQLPEEADRIAIVASLRQDSRIRLVTMPPEMGGQ
ncbi:MAG: hypothetical protein ACREVI_03445 [Steroidobacteraceae bacterium]